MLFTYLIFSSFLLCRLFPKAFAWISSISIKSPYYSSHLQTISPHFFKIFSREDKFADIDDIEVRNALLEAEINDYEWLTGIFGENLEGLNLNRNSTVNVVTANVAEKSTIDALETKSNKSSTDNQVKTSDDEALEESEFYNLGYSENEILSLLPSIKSLILERSVRRPINGIPTEWLIQYVQEDNASIPKNVEKVVTTKTNKKIRYVEDDVSEKRDYRKDSYTSESKRPVSNFRQSSNPYRSNEFMGNAPPRQSPLPKTKSTSSTSKDTKPFAWSGKPLTPSEMETSAELETERSRQRNSSNQKRRSSSTIPSYERNEPEKPFSFWPDTQEFKDLLLDESKWRVDMVGKWATPLIREETRWRYKLYKGWLQFLDDGFGDGFDEVPDSFERRGGMTQTNYDNSNVNNVRRGYRSRRSNLDPWESSENIPDEVEDDEEEEDMQNTDSRIDNDINRRRRRRSSPREEYNKEKEEYLLKKHASEYENWLKSNIRSESWTDVAEEESDVRRLQEYERMNSFDMNDESIWFEEDKTDVSIEDEFQEINLGVDSLRNTRKEQFNKIKQQERNKLEINEDNISRGSGGRQYVDRKKVPKSMGKSERDGSSSSSSSSSERNSIPQRPQQYYYGETDDV